MPLYVPCICLCMCIDRQLKDIKFVVCYLYICQFLLQLMCIIGYILIPWFVLMYFRGLC